MTGYTINDIEHSGDLYKFPRGTVFKTAERMQKVLDIINFAEMDCLDEIVDKLHSFCKEQGMT